MGMLNGVHHLAIATGGIKKQIEFFSDVLGMELVALYWMHGVEGAWHGFMRLGDSSSVAFVETAGIRAIEPAIGSTHAGNPGADCARGAMQHLAFNVDSDEALFAMRDRIRSRGVPVMGPLDHGFCKSIYFAGPENLSLEVSTSAFAIDANAWIDPEVVALAGIDAAELHRYRQPARYAKPAQAVPQPKLDGPGPHMVYKDPRAYRRIMEMPDDVLTKTHSESTPPVAVPVAAGK